LLDAADFGLLIVSWLYTVLVYLVWCNLRFFYEDQRRVQRKVKGEFRIWFEHFATFMQLAGIADITGDPTFRVIVRDLRNI